MNNNEELLEFIEKYFDEEVKIQPFQRQFIEILEKRDLKFNREKKANEFALLPHEYGNRFAPLTEREKIEINAEAAFAPIRDKIEILPRNPCGEEVLSKHWEHWKSMSSEHPCTAIDCPVCQAIEEEVKSNDFISEEEMKL